MRRRLRFVGGIVTLGLVTLLVLVDSLGRLLVRPDFHVSELIFGTLSGTFVAILGLEGITRLPGGKG